MQNKPKKEEIKMKAIINIEIVEHNNYESFDKEINGENITECKKKLTY